MQPFSAFRQHRKSLSLTKKIYLSCEHYFSSQYQPMLHPSYSCVFHVTMFPPIALVCLFLYGLHTTPNFSICSAEGLTLTLGPSLSKMSSCGQASPKRTFFYTIPSFAPKVTIPELTILIPSLTRWEKTSSLPSSWLRTMGPLGHEQTVEGLRWKL